RRRVRSAVRGAARQSDAGGAVDRGGARRARRRRRGLPAAVRRRAADGAVGAGLRPALAHQDLRAARPAPRLPPRHAAGRARGAGGAAAVERVAAGGRRRPGRARRADRAGARQDRRAARPHDRAPRRQRHRARRRRRQLRGRRRRRRGPLRRRHAGARRARTRLHELRPARVRAPRRARRRRGVTPRRRVADCNPVRFSDDDRRAVYDVIGKRRDIRHFRAGAPLGDDVLERILAAAHQAPSVGYSQPWDFVVVRDRARRERIRDSFLRVRAAEAVRFPAGERREQYLAYKLEGILDAAVNVCVTVDLRPADEAVLGTTAQPESLRWSACCAVQNLWLAARAEGIGVGWVSIVEPTVLRRELGLPPGIEPVAYLCVGEPIEFRDRPLLEETGWRARRPVADAIHREQFAASAPRSVGRTPAPNSGIPEIPGFDRASATAVTETWRTRCKPHGALGRLEPLAAWYAGARGTPTPAPPTRIELFVFAGDHGVVEEGVSAWPSSVTAAMVGNMLAGGAAVSVLAAAADVALTVVDVGV